MSDYKLFPLSINYKGNKHAYYYLYFKNEDLEFISFPGSKFLIKNDLRESKEIDFDSRQSFENFLKDELLNYNKNLHGDFGMPKIGHHKRILEENKNSWYLERVLKLKISKAKLSTRDIFSVRRDTSIYVSEKFVELINRSGISGIKFIETNKIIIE